ncbi:hypothetical protein HDC93_003437 [Streptomyces sp. AK010]|nr:hypothetical protein [Streptomyces sp. AK010]
MSILAAADIGQLLQLVPVQRAGLALLVAAVGLPVIGVVIVGLGIMPVRFAMMHVALLGIAVGLLTGLDPMLCALVACALAGAGVAPLARTPDGLSGAMGLLMSLAIAAALLVLAVSGVNAAGSFALLWDPFSRSAPPTCGWSQPSPLSYRSCSGGAAGTSRSSSTTVSSPCPRACASSGSPSCCWSWSPWRPPEPSSSPVLSSSTR